MARWLKKKSDLELQAEPESAFEEQAFWQKVTRLIKVKGKQAVQDALETALKLYYALRDPETPAWAKAVIYGALAYFIMPIDLIPDLMPTGYVDDLSTLVAALSTVSAHVKEEHLDKARAKIASLFGQKLMDDEDKTVS